MSASNQDFLFAQEAQRLGYVTESQVEEAFKLQRIMSDELKIDEQLDVILVKRGWIADEQARRVHARLEPEGRRSEIEGYRLLEKIGRGAMGTVYRALHLGLQRIVAVKVLHQDLAADETQVARLKSEAKLLASLDHPNIVRALDAGESGGFPYIVMEHVEGVTLRERLQKSGPFAEAEALRIVRGLADALERARRMGVVHRDVKPGNVLLTRQGEPKLMDLGLAKGPVDLELTQHGATVGTPQYISPEQAQDPRKADTRSDIYSLGATLYALVTGRPPFDGTTLAEILAKVLYENPTPPRVLAPGLSAATGYLIERMMVKDPSLRYHTPADVVRDIDRILAGQSIMPAGFRGNWEAYLLRQRIRRRTTWGAIALAALLLLGFGLRVWLARQAQERGMEEARALIAAVQPEVRYGAQDDLVSVLAKRERLGDALDRVEHLDLPEVEALRGQRLRLERLSQSLTRFGALTGMSDPSPGPGTIAGLTARGDYAQALKRLEDFEARGGVEPPGGDNPLGPLLADLRQALRRRSQKAFVDLVSEVQARRPETLEAWCDGFRDFDARAHAGFVPELEAREGVRRAGELLSLSVTVAQAVQALEARLSPDAIAARLTSLDLGSLRADVQRERERVLDLVQTAWQAPEQVWTPRESLVGPAGLVTARLRTLAERVDAQIAAHGAALQVRAQELARAGRAPEGIALLDRFEKAAFDAGYREESFAARAVAQGLSQADQAALAQAERAFSAVLARWLKALRPLEAGSAGALAAAVSLSEAERQALVGRTADVARLEEVSAHLERLFDLAMEGLEVVARRRQPLPPRLRQAGASEKGWVVTSVDRQARSFYAQGPREREPVRRSLFDLAPDQVVELARLAPGAGAQRAALALGELALLPPLNPAPASEADLAPALEAYVACQRALESAGLLEGPLGAWVGQGLDRLVKERDLAEQGAFRLHEQARIFMRQIPPRLSSAYHWLKQLQESPRLMRTEYARAHAAEVQALWAAVEEAMGRENMGRRLAGVHAEKQADGTWHLLYDFDTDDQILPANFSRGCGVLEPFSGPQVTPSAEKVNQRLHLLRGYESPVREVPLTWPCLFDPAETISVSFDLYALDGPFVVGVDVDGVQVAILCLDPNWYPDMVFPPDVPLLEDEKRQARLLNAYGRGRGVAFHDGSDFGDLSQWADGKGGGPGTAWAREGRGARHADWAGKPEQPGRLFAFPPSAQVPGRSYVRVKVVRERARLSLFVADPKRDKDYVLIATETRPEWANRGKDSERVRSMSRGTGVVQLLTWTPVAIDNLRLEGTLKESWLKR